GSALRSWRRSVRVPHGHSRDARLSKDLERIDVDARVPGRADDDELEGVGAARRPEAAPGHVPVAEGDGVQIDASDERAVEVDVDRAPVRPAAGDEGAATTGEGERRRGAGGRRVPA